MRFFAGAQNDMMEKSYSARHAELVSASIPSRTDRFTADSTPLMLSVSKHEVKKRCSPFDCAQGERALILLTALIADVNPLITARRSVARKGLILRISFGPAQGRPISESKKRLLKQACPEQGRRIQHEDSLGVILRFIQRNTEPA